MCVRGRSRSRGRRRRTCVLGRSRGRGCRRHRCRPRRRRGPLHRRLRHGMRGRWRRTRAPSSRGRHRLPFGTTLAGLFPSLSFRRTVVGRRPPSRYGFYASRRSERRGMRRGLRRRRRNGRRSRTDCGASRRGGACLRPKIDSFGAFEGGDRLRPKIDSAGGRLLRRARRPRHRLFGFVREGFRRFGRSLDRSVRSGARRDGRFSNRSHLGRCRARLLFRFGEGSGMSGRGRLVGRAARFRSTFPSRSVARFVVRERAGNRLHGHLARPCYERQRIEGWRARERFSAREQRRSVDRRGQCAR